MNAAYVIVALPLAGAPILLFGGRRTGDPPCGWIATLMAAGSFVATIVVWATLLAESPSDRTVDKTIFTWIPVDTLHVNFGLQLDPLSVLWCLFVTGVGSLITLYSIGYMKGDSSYGRFFFYMNLFLFSMIVLVLADNFCSASSAGRASGSAPTGWSVLVRAAQRAVAAKKAFVTNRIGDFGFMIALFLIFGHFHSFNYSTVLAPLSAGSHPGRRHGHGLGLLLFLGAVGKSAQIPLYMWLPDAMEGPTPVSALIHAATMVTAGVYLIARSAPILHFSSSTQWVIASIGAATALFAATIACAQDDIKRVLAYSTSPSSATCSWPKAREATRRASIHTVMHAFFKAALFLSAGAIIHSLHDEQNMKRMGGLLARTSASPVCPSLSASWPCPPSHPLTGSGPRTTSCRPPGTRARRYGPSACDRRTDRLLHEPPSDVGVRRPSPLGRTCRRPRGGRDRRRRWTAGATPSPGAREPAPHRSAARERPDAPRGAAGHDAAADRPGSGLDHRMADQRPLRRPRLPQQVAGTGVSQPPSPRPSGGDRHQVDDRR